MCLPIVQASQLSQLFSHAFKLAYAHKELRRSLKGKSKGPSDVDVKASKKPWDVFKPGKGKKSKSASSLPSDSSASPSGRSRSPPLSPSTPHDSHSSALLPSASAGSVAEAEPPPDYTPFQNRRHSSISSSGKSAQVFMRPFLEDPQFHHGYSGTLATVIHTRYDSPEADIMK